MLREGERFRVLDRGGAHVHTEHSSARREIQGSGLATQAAIIGKIFDWNLAATRCDACARQLVTIGMQCDAVGDGFSAAVCIHEPTHTARTQRTKMQRCGTRVIEWSRTRLVGAVDSLVVAMTSRARWIRNVVRLTIVAWARAHTHAAPCGIFSASLSPSFSPCLSGLRCVALYPRSWNWILFHLETRPSDSACSAAGTTGPIEWKPGRKSCGIQSLMKFGRPPYRCTRAREYTSWFFSTPFFLLRCFARRVFKSSGWNWILFTTCSIFFVTYNPKITVSVYSSVTLVISL